MDGHFKRLWNGLLTMSIEPDPLFKGCTRPAMLFGLPLPVCIGFGMISLILAVFVNFFMLVLAVPVYFTLRAIVKHDDQQFRLLYFKAIYRWSYVTRNLRFWRASVYAPVRFTSKKDRKHLKIKKRKGLK